MKLKNIGRAVLATGMSLAIGLGATACSRDYTVAYVYAASKGAAAGTVSAYAVDYQSGALTQINGSPFSGPGRVPVAILPTPNGKTLYVINHDDSTVTEFSIGTDGKLYGQNTYNTTGTYPTAAAVDSTGSYLYVTFTYQIGYTPASPGPGGITIFPISQSGSGAGSLGTPLTVNGLNYVPLGNNPVSIAVSNPVSSNTFVYVVDQEAAPNADIIGFVQNSSTGALTLATGSTCNTTVTPNTCAGTLAGTTPSSIVIEPASTYAYVADKTGNQIYGYRIGNSNGSLTPLVRSPFGSTGLYPVNLIVDPRGKYLYTANLNSNTVSGFVIDFSDGSLSAVASTGTASVGTGPTCVAIEPALGIYLYTSNSIDGSISGEKLNGNTGQLTQIENTPFPSSTLPSCVTAVANGSEAHAQSIVVH